MCIKCHGDIENEINKKTRFNIDDLYPDDKAIRYSSN